MSMITYEMKIYRKTVQHKWSTEVKVLQINSANEASDSDFYIKKVGEPLKLSFPYEKERNSVHKIKFTNSLHLFFTLCTFYTKCLYTII